MFIMCHRAALVRSPDTQEGFTEDMSCPLPGQSRLSSPRPELHMLSIREPSGPLNHSNPKPQTQGQIHITPGALSNGHEGMGTQGPDISCRWAFWSFSQGHDPLRGAS